MFFELGDPEKWGIHPNHVISTCVNIGLSVNIGRDMFYISFNNTFY